MSILDEPSGNRRPAASNSAAVLDVTTLFSLLATAAESE
jgi:hypothetical protein